MKTLRYSAGTVSFEKRSAANAFDRYLTFSHQRKMMTHGLSWCRLLLVCVVALLTPASIAFSTSTHTPIKVLVTGAAGKTGRLVLKKLLKDPRYEPKALVRTEHSARCLIKGDVHCPLEHIVVSDITSPTFQQDLLSGLDGTKAMIVCTSAVPRISRRSLVAALFQAPWNIVRKRKAIDFRSFRFKWKDGGYPEKVDYLGQLAQIQLAKKLGMDHIIIVSSMGGTKPSNFLNRVGKKKDGSGNGDILLWKRKAEIYLVESGLDHTIIHPGGLLDTPCGLNEYVLDVDDNLGKTHSRTCIGREDVAELCVAALSVAKGQNVSFDCITREPEDEDTEPKTAEEALSEFLEQAKTANYAY